MLSSNWLEIVPGKPLKAERQLQYLMIEVEEPFEPDGETLGLRLKNGLLIVPQAQLIDQEGKVYDLPSRMLVPTGIGLGMFELPKDKVFRAVRIRSEGPLKVSRIYWRCYNQWDVG